jgi:hypothetical protein
MFRNRFFKETHDIFFIMRSAVDREVMAMQRLFDEVGIATHMLSHKEQRSSPPVRLNVFTGLLQEVKRIQGLEANLQEEIEFDEEVRMKKFDADSSPGVAAESKKLAELETIE